MEMKQLEPKAVRSQWLWFAAALLAMIIIAFMTTSYHG
jgi:hypothetical protein